MSWTLSWLVEKRVLVSILEGELLESDVAEFDQQMNHFLDQGMGRVHVVGDMTQIDSMPSLSAMQKFTFARHPKLGWMLGVGAKPNPLIRMTVYVLARFFNNRFRLFDTWKAALGFLQAMDRTLPDLSATPRPEVESPA